MRNQAGEAAERLTKAQRDMMIAAEPYGNWMLIRWPNRARPEGWAGKKLSLYWNPDYDSLTSDGLAVRAHLIDRGGRDDASS